MSVTLQIERAIRQRADWYRNALIPEAPVRIRARTETSRYFGSYEVWDTYFADYISVTDAGYATELEVKTSRADWRADLKKPKWMDGAFPAWISRFIYVVPEKLGIPEWVPSIAGVWHLKEGGNRLRPQTYIEVARNPRRVGKEKVPKNILDGWMEAFYYRFWRLRVDLDRRIGAQEDLQRERREKRLALA